MIWGSGLWVEGLGSSELTKHFMGKAHVVQFSCLTRFSIAIQAERIQGIGLSLCGLTIKAQGSRLRALGDNGFERKI